MKEPDFAIEEATKFFAEIFCGEHHIPGEIKPFGRGWCVLVSREFATTDFNDLTRLVLLSHETGIRAGIHPAGPKIKISLHKRESGATDLIAGHPTIDQALEAWKTRKTYTS